MDNADEPKVNSIVGDLCHLANVGNGKRWYSMWDGMVVDQKLKLEPLSERHAMEVLVRGLLGCPSETVEYQEVLDKLDEIRVRNPAEYDGLVELAGCKEKHGIGGLPLGLGQAGSYINRYQCSFLEYLQRYKDARRSASPERLFRHIADSGQLSYEQR